MTNSLSLAELTRTLEASGFCLGVREGRLKIKGRRQALTPALMQAIRDHSAALLRKAMADQYAPLLLDLWQGDVIGPMACWLWFEVDDLPMDTWIATGLYADRALYRRIREGIEAGPSFQNKAHLRGALLALYDHVQRGNVEGLT